ncbi:glycosyltransferase involved in cell wall biosynthesis [Serratia fonticola]|uniref:Glycosyltransferase involved in cell wall biosynthesis n=1 Tax=Serratia fonticola TaxID=47917 RepID=A0A542D509_SERFO|nr:glycosyltransferase family 4 protein [Serratia fonticola]TQI79809.1 glycosyltransferase involved in cell wall biosynthesis [Serratia fonticola]TQI98166.1 glycosyltransferase involved in cell wall biosynthesis [Serratia fonticola]TVZ67694.1 glycosyltransferase involved in cell wall biosynthesis [Serratia fonticola]
MKRKVAVIYHFFPHYRSGIIKELLKSNDFDFHFYGSDIEEYYGIKRCKDVPLDKFHITRFSKMKNFVFQEGLLKLAMSKEYDALIILADPHFVMTWPCSLLAKLKKKKVLFWTHGWTKDLSGIKYKIKKIYHQLSDGLLLYGDRAKNITVENGYPPEKVYVIYNSLDYELQLEARNLLEKKYELDVDRREFYGNADGAIVTVARLIETCRFDLLIDAIYILKSQGYLPMVNIIGDGPVRGKLEKYAREKNVADQIKFWGACYDESLLSRVIYSADVTVSPGKVGLLAMHSLNYGTPVITHDSFDMQMPEYEAIIQDKTGGFFIHNDSMSLAKEIKKWISNKKSKETIKACHEMIDKTYNPYFQSLKIHEALYEEK